MEPTQGAGGHPPLPHPREDLRLRSRFLVTLGDRNDRPLDRSDPTGWGAHEAF